MVEAALILPILLLLLLLAIDFGRVFFGWIGLQNAARIGASYAAAHPQAWNTAGDPDQAEYQLQIAQDAAGINCALPSPASNPTFPDGTSLGSDAKLDLTCDFSIVTPLVSNILGSPITIHATSVFPIRTGCPGCPAPPPASPDPSTTPAPSAPPVEATDPCITVPNLVGASVAGARNMWTWSGFVGSFIPAAGADDTKTVLTQITSPTTPAPPYNCLKPDATVSVTFDPPPDPPDAACTGLLYVPNVLRITVAEGRTAWVGAGFPEASFTPDATAGVDTMIVETQTVGPAAATPGSCVDPASTLTVTYGPQPQPPPPTCEVWSLISIHTNDAQAVWQSRGFTSKVNFEKKQELIPPGYIIQRQNLVADSWVPCDQVIKVGP